MQSRIFFSVIFVLISVVGIGQQSNDSSATHQPVSKVIAYKPDTHEVLSYTEVMPMFKGEEGAFNQYLSENIKYPAIEKDKGKVVIVYVSFIVERNGAITNVKEAKGVPGFPDLTTEALRVISAMPLWTPGTMVGIPVRVHMTQPVRFILSQSNPSFPGGDEALAEYIKHNLIYPKKEKRKHKEGMVVLRFTVEADGSISNVLVNSEVKGAPGFTAEAKRLVAQMPKWNAGKVNEKATAMPGEVRITFKL